MRNLQRLRRKNRRKNPRAFWLTAGGLSLAIVITAAIISMIPAIIFLRHISQGQHLYEKGDYQNALEEYNKALKMPVQYWPWLALFSRGTIQGKLGKFKEQLKDCQEATIGKKENALAWNCLGLALKALERYDEAIFAFDKAIYWAENEERLGSPEKRLAVEIEATYNKGEALLNNEEPERAIATLENALQLAQDNQFENFNYSIYDFLSKAYLDKKEYPKSLEYSELAINQKPESFTPRLRLGMAYNSMKKYQEAITKFDEIIRNSEKYQWTDDDLAKVWYHKGQAWEALEEYNSALAAQNKALEYDPEYPYALEAKNKLIEKMKK